MIVTVSLSVPEQNYKDEIQIRNIANPNHFSYIGNDKCSYEISIYEQGLCLFKQSEEYSLQLHLCGDNYAKISSKEGIIKLDTKVVDFIRNNDILVMRYLVDETERIIEIKFEWEN